MRFALVSVQGEVLLELELVKRPGWKAARGAKLCRTLIEAAKAGRDLSAIWPVTRLHLIAERAQLRAARRVAELEQRGGDTAG